MRGDQSRIKETENDKQGGERDYPKGDPRAADYTGEDYIPPSAPYARDYEAGHPSAADSPENIAQSERDRKERSVHSQSGKIE